MTDTTHSSSKSGMTLTKRDETSPLGIIEKNQYKGKKLQRYRHDGITKPVQSQLKIGLLRISKNLGIQNPPDQTDLDGIIVFLINNFGDFTPAEVMHSFELFAAGILDGEERGGKVVAIERPYGTFNLSFIGSVCKAYRKYRFEMLPKVPESHQLQETNAQSQSVQTEEEWQEMNYNLIRKYIQDNKHIPVTGSYAAAFIHLERLGLVNMTTEEKITFRDDTRNARMEILRAKLSDNPFKRFEFVKEMEELQNDKSHVLKTLVREAAAKNYFTENLFNIINEKPNTETEK